MKTQFDNPLNFWMRRKGDWVRNPAMLPRATALAKRLGFADVWSKLASEQRRRVA